MSDQPAPRIVTLQSLSNRLRIKTPMVRKIAIMDMLHRQQEFGVEAVAEVLLKHLPRETHLPLVVKIAGHLGDIRFTPALEALRSLADDVSTDPTIAQAARQAVERIMQA